MAFTPITGQPVQYSTEDNEIASGYYLKFYDVGTLNGYSVAVDSTGTPTLAKVKLSTSGYPISNPADNNTVFIPHVNQDYRMILYKNETDADADTTANADWNVDSISQNIAPSADAKDITLRNVDVETQDDYDRSPLFIDGGGFTAGAGPHVITPDVVTPAWVPNNADTRFYRVDNSGIVTELTPTAKDATTFTLAETLLSTDTIFIGDDNFRNQMDGDPLDIRTRLDVYSTTETDTADNLRLEKSDNLAAVASASTSRTNLDVYGKSETYTQAETATEIASGVAPRLATRTNVFTGSSTSIDFDSFAGGHPGDGFYLITYSGIIHLCYVIEGQQMKAYGDSFADTTPRTDVTEINYSGGNVMTVTQNSTSSGATSISITSIDKIG